MKRPRRQREPRNGSSDAPTRSSEGAIARHDRGYEDLQHAAGNQAVQELLRGLSPERTHDAAPPARSAATPAAEGGVEQALGSGRALDEETRAAMGQKLGADFGDVRIHDDAAAAESARRLHALAYTLGNHIVVGREGLSQHSPEGRGLLAHELAHTMQQRRDPRPRIQRQPPPGNTVDVDVTAESQAEAERLKGGGVNLPQVGQQTWQAIGGSPYATVLPGYSQQGETCGAASLVSALLIWDREHWDPAQPNSHAVDACNLILAELEKHGAQAAERWATNNPLPPCAGDHACNVAAWTRQRDTFIATLAGIRDRARTPGGKVESGDYEQMGQSLYYLWKKDRGPGLSTGDIFQIQKLLGLGTQISSGLPDFDAIFTNSIVTGLGPDEMAQIFWIVVPTYQQHAFLIGRVSTGKWFLSDQGTKPATEMQTDTLEALHQGVRIAAAGGSYWLFAGSTADYVQQTGRMAPFYTGVQKLGSPGSTHEAVRQTIPAGTALGQVDVGYFTIGDDITSGSYVGQQYSLNEAAASLPPSVGGGVIVEMPAGVFTVYQTSAVSDANLDQTSLDAGDSASMLLGSGRKFHHAWLILGNRFGLRRSWFQVY